VPSKEMDGEIPPKMFSHGQVWLVISDNAKHVDAVNNLWMTEPVEIAHHSRMLSMILHLEEQFADRRPVA